MSGKDKFLVVENISKTYGEGHSLVKAVANVSLSVGKGEIVLIMGPSGSGKTSLLTMLGSLLSPDKGQIYYDGLDVTSLSSSKLSQMRANNLGFVFQSFNLIESLNSWQNVAIVQEFAGAKSPVAQTRAKGLLQKLGLEKRLDQNVAQLSGGEKQRVSIARALALDPSLILADEPTANLDSKNGHKVMQLLCEVACREKKAVVIVSHDSRIKDIASRILQLEDGKITSSELGGHSKTCTMTKHY